MPIAFIMYTYKTWMRFSSWTWKMCTKLRVLIVSVDAKVLLASYFYVKNATRIKTYMFSQCLVGIYAGVCFLNWYLGVKWKPVLYHPGGSWCWKLEIFLRNCDFYEYVWYLKCLQWKVI